MATASAYSLQDMAGNELLRTGSIPNPMHLPNGDQVCGASAGWNNGTYQLVEISWDVPDPAQEVPDIISDRQFFQALAMSGTITTDEALAAVKTGTLPAKMQTALDAMAPSDRFNAEMMLSGATQFQRSNPMTNSMMQVMGWDAKSTDDLWRYASTL
jgi:hypothetical protein